MSSKKITPAVDPVVLVTFGVLMLAVVIVLFTLLPNPQPTAENADSSIVGQMVVAFITGLTTGGLSCLAMQGGLLASSLAHQIEQDYVGQSINSKQKQKTPVRTNTVFPIFLFLVAKVIAYTLLGALLGWLG